MKVEKWGDSLAIRIPTDVVDALLLKEGDEVEIHVASECALAINKEPSFQERLIRLRRFRNVMPEGLRFNREEANER